MKQKIMVDKKTFNRVIDSIVNNGSESEKFAESLAKQIWKKLVNESKEAFTYDWIDTITKKQLKAYDNDWGNAIENIIGDVDWMGINDKQAIVLDCRDGTIGLVEFFDYE